MECRIDGCDEEATRVKVAGHETEGFQWCDSHADEAETLGLI